MKKNISVMVLDDEPIVWERLQPVLEKEGYQLVDKAAKKFK
jgi:hypothetical protein